MHLEYRGRAGSESISEPDDWVEVPDEDDEEYEEDDREYDDYDPDDEVCDDSYADAYFAKQQEQSDKFWGDQR